MREALRHGIPWKFLEPWNRHWIERVIVCMMPKSHHAISRICFEPRHLSWFRKKRADACFEEHLLKILLCRTSMGGQFDK
jgi:hypothetical protein